MQFLPVTHVANYAPTFRRLCYLSKISSRIINLRGCYKTVKRVFPPFGINFIILPLELSTMASRVKLSPASILLIALIIIVVFSNDVVAFGAGNIPS